MEHVLAGGMDAAAPHETRMRQGQQASGLNNNTSTHLHTHTREVCVCGWNTESHITVPMKHE